MGPGSSKRTLAAARVRLARTMRWAIVDSGARNARATSSVLRPHTSLRVSAERASGDRIGWQDMKIKPSRSSAEVAVDTWSTSISGCGRRGRGHLSVLAPLGVAATDPVDGQEPCGGVQPGRRVVRHAVSSPLLDGGHERVLGEFLGGVDVTDEPDQAGDQAR